MASGHKYFFALRAQSHYLCPPFSKILATPLLLGNPMGLKLLVVLSMSYLPVLVRGSGDVPVQRAHVGEECNLIIGSLHYIAVGI